MFHATEGTQNLAKSHFFKNTVFLKDCCGNLPSEFVNDPWKGSLTTRCPQRSNKAASNTGSFLTQQNKAARNK